MKCIENRELQLKTKTNNRTIGSLVKPPADEVKSLKVPLMAQTHASSQLNPGRDKFDCTHGILYCPISNEAANQGNLMRVFGVISNQGLLQEGNIEGRNQINSLSPRSLKSRMGAPMKNFPTRPSDDAAYHQYVHRVLEATSNQCWSSITPQVVGILGKEAASNISEELGYGQLYFI